MVLTVETGAGLADAESYATVAEFKAYAGKIGYDYSDYTDTQIEQALRRATTWLDARYASTFQGIWTTSTQALQWPRSGVLYRLTSIDSDEIPSKLKDALCEAVWRELAYPGRLTPDAMGGEIKRDSVGDVSTEFRLLAVGQSPSLKIVDDLLADLLTGRASAFVGRAVRG